MDLDGFTKGMVYVNGFHLGRYWSCGPQKTLYLPGVLLHTDRPNELVVLELEGATPSPRCGSPMDTAWDRSWCIS